ncbi:MAG: hypothetical protein KGL38_13730 [Gemmatimonadota bacterium]|nr:hypothetical protein [Gemmatimonadota bacterium]MDE3173515.1 hypothetical protein [Gemmatimonadota bacterium]
MNPAFVRRSTLLLAGFVLLGACQDKRVKELNTGITRDSVLSVTAQGTIGADSMPGIYKRGQYLINGKTLEVLYFDSRNRKAGKDTVPNSQLTPLVVLEGKLVGKGWPVWDSVAKANNIPVEKH